MNREIKFRGKRKDNGEWVYGYLFVSWDWFYILWGTTNDIPNMIEVIPETVGQFTGLHDKNGVEIYEGDKVRLKHGSKGMERVGIISWSQQSTGFYARESKMKQFGWTLDTQYIEVIGNIHENPELLKD